MTVMLNYDELKADFNNKLLTQLRGHSSTSEYLESWVPDDDPVKSILNMVESAILGGATDMCIQFNAATMSESQRTELVAEIAKFAMAKVADRGDVCDLIVYQTKD